MSYSHMPNIGDIINMHNKPTLTNPIEKPKMKICNPNPSIRPLEGKCKEGPIVYKATLTSQNKSMVYNGSCETKFKIRYITTNKTSSLKTKNTPQNSRKQCGML